MDGTEKLMRKLLEVNGLEEADLVSVQFTVTQDLTAANPATAFRRLGYASTPLFCSLEPPFDGAMQKVVRVLLTADVDEGRELRPVYIQGAEKLRPDLQESEPDVGDGKRAGGSNREGDRRSGGGNRERGGAGSEGKG
jgi:chorismate mutase